MYRNMVTSLLAHERIETTLAKAKELRGKTERNITIALRLGDILAKDKESRTREEQDKVVHAMRLVGRTVQDREVLHKLFEDIAPRLAGRPGGYTRIIRTRRRVGDAAEMAIIELVCREEEKAA
jgi:large subunit ribosomal protein L17